MDEVTEKPERSKPFQTVLVATALGVLIVFGGFEWKQQRDLQQQRDVSQVQMQQLTDQNQKLSESMQSLQAESAEANATLEDVAKGLEEIRAKELKAIQSSIRVAREGEAAGSRRHQLEADIQAIRDAIHKNLQKLARLEKNNKESGLKVASLQMLADQLKRSLEEREATVAELQNKVGDLSKTVETQATSLAEKDAAILERETRIAEKTKESNTAYVAVASKSVLKQSGVVEKQGAILGVGGRWIETGKFDPGVFREIDLTKEREVSIPAPARKVRIITEQPRESFRVVDSGPNSGSSKLEVKDPAAFWKGDRYLVVMIPD